MAHTIVNEKTNVIIEFSNNNGHVRLIKEENYHVDKWGLKFLHKRAYSPFVIQYSSDGIKWSSCAKYRSDVKNIQHTHFHKAVAALKEGTSIKTLRR